MTAQPCHAGADHGPASYCLRCGWLFDACWCWLYLRGWAPMRGER